MKKTFWLLLLILAAGAIFRLGYILEPHMDSDQAIFGLAGWHVLHGEFPAFQWNYHYMGTLQSFLDAIPFAIFGLNRYALNSIPLFLSLVFILTTFFLAKIIFEDKKTALIAALFCAIGPYFLVLHGAWARHGYLETMTFGSILMLLTVKIVFKNPAQQEKNKYYLWLAFIAGVAWWTNFLILYYFALCGPFLLWNDKKLFFRKVFLKMLGLFILGSLPFWIHNFYYDFASFSIFFKKGDVHLWNNILTFFKDKLPVILGIREKENPFFKILGYVLYGFSFLWLVTRKHPKSLWLPFVFILIIIYLQSSSFYGVENTQRHLLPLYSVIPLFLARVYKTLCSRWQIAAYSYVGLLLVLFVYDNSLSHPFVHPERIKRHREDMATKQKLKQTLLNKEIYGAYAYDYWVGPVITFDMKEEIVFPHPFLDRYPLYIRKADSLWKPAFLTVGGNETLEKAFKGLNLSFTKFNAPPFDFYSSFNRNGTESEQISNRDWKLTASSKPDQAFMAADNNLRSVWMSSEAQQKGMTFTIELPRPEKINKIELYIGNADLGIPEKFKIYRSLDGKNWNEVRNIGPYWSFFWDGPHPFHHGIYDRKEINMQAMETRFIKFELTEPNHEHPHYWAFAEICLYRQIDTPYEKLTQADIKEVIERLKNYRKYKIFPTVWLSAYLQENYPKFKTASVWRSAIKNDLKKIRIFRIQDPVVLIAPTETENEISNRLKELNLKFNQEKMHRFSLFSIEPSNSKNRYYWSGKQLFDWKRIRL